MTLKAARGQARSAPSDDAGDPAGTGPFRLPEGTRQYYGLQTKLNLGASPADGDHVKDAAQRGLSGAAHSLPHQAEIQRAFGRHDVGHVRAHTDEQAVQSCRDLNAEGFATGDRVAFAGSPSLHTAAHEAAHVVQQQHGVQRKSDGGGGDVYERHADEVADRVVRGESAEALLDAHGGGGGGHAMQRKIVVGGTSGRSFGPADEPLEALEKDFESQGVKLDGGQRKKLQALFAEGEHDYADLDELLAKNFGMVGGLGKPQPKGEGETSTDAKGNEWFVTEK